MNVWDFGEWWYRDDGFYIGVVRYWVLVVDVCVVVGVCVGEFVCVCVCVCVCV